MGTSDKSWDQNHSGQLHGGGGIPGLICHYLNDILKHFCVAVIEVSYNFDVHCSAMVEGPFYGHSRSGRTGVSGY